MLVSGHAVTSTSARSSLFAGVAALGAVPLDPTLLFGKFDELRRQSLPVREDRRQVMCEGNRCLAGVLISGEDRAGRSAAGCPRSVASTDAA